MKTTFEYRAILVTSSLDEIFSRYRSLARKVPLSFDPAELVYKLKLGAPGAVVSLPSQTIFSNRRSRSPCLPLPPPSKISLHTQQPDLLSSA